MEPETKENMKQPLDGNDGQTSERPPLAPLASHGSKWRQLLGQRKSLLVFVAILAAALLARFALLRQPLPTCRDASQRRAKDVVLVCDREYGRTKNPSTGAILADMLRRAQNFPAAKKVANELRGTSAHAEALAVLGKIANAENEFHLAKPLLEEATAVFSKAGNWRSAAVTLLALARASRNQQEQLNAINQLTRCASLAQTAGDSGVEAACQLALSVTLLEVGDDVGALHALDEARKNGTPQEIAEAEMYHADYLQQTGELFQSVARFKKALANEGISALNTIYAHIDLANSLIEVSRLEEAREHLQMAKDLDTTNSYEAPRMAIEGLLKSRSKDPKDLEEADALFADAVKKLESYEQNDKAQIYMDRTDLALARGDNAHAVEYARQTIVWIDEIRAKQQLPQYRSWITQEYRRAYELQFLSLARDGQVEAALHALDRWQRQEALDRLLPVAAPAAADGSRDDWMNAKELARVTRSLQVSAFTVDHGLAELKKQLGEEDLLALVVARKEVWRLAAHRGRLRLDRLGDLADLAPRLIDTFKAVPSDAPTAAALGALLIPAEQAIASDNVLHVLLDAELADLPFEALRIRDQTVTGLRPIVRVLRPDAGCAEPSKADSPAVLLADPGGDLLHARKVVPALGANLGANVEVLLGKDASLGALEKPAALLHLSLHSDIDRDGGYLRLFDGNRRATDIATRGNAPATVMLFSCLSAVAKAGNYSIATAYLTAGAHQVIATLHEVSDKGAAEVALKFYSHGGARDPVRAMAKTQAELAKTNNADWFHFAVYGRQTCKARKAP